MLPCYANTKCFSTDPIRRLNKPVALPSRLMNFVLLVLELFLEFQIFLFVSLVCFFLVLIGVKIKILTNFTVLKRTSTLPNFQVYYRGIREERLDHRRQDFQVFYNKKSYDITKKFAQNNNYNLEVRLIIEFLYFSLASASLGSIIIAPGG